MTKSNDSLFRVICVDDNRDAADTLGILLELVGFESLVCYDGKSALAAAATFRPDAAILDLTMPEMDGVELGIRLRAQPWAKTIPLVALTALGGDEARERTANAGFDLHLTKPVDPDRLATVLADIVILKSDSWQGETKLPAGVALHSRN